MNTKVKVIKFNHTLLSSLWALSKLILNFLDLQTSKKLSNAQLSKAHLVLLNRSITYLTVPPLNKQSLIVFNWSFSYSKFRLKQKYKKYSRACGSENIHIKCWSSCFGWRAYGNLFESSSLLYSYIIWINKTQKIIGLSHYGSQELIKFVFQ